MRNLIVLVAVAAFALALGFGLNAWRHTTSAPAMQARVATVLPAPRPLPEFALLDQDGRPFTRASLQGGWSLLFFGFTNCPDICPNTLGLLQAVKSRLGPGAPRVVFVSVDPARDTPPVMKAYVAYFDPDFIGASGPEAELKKLADALYLPYALVPTGDGTQYQVEHSGGLVLVNAQAQAVAYFSPPLQVAPIVEDLRAIVKG
jgi:protein SCO1/2